MSIGRRRGLRRGVWTALWAGGLAWAAAPLHAQVADWSARYDSGLVATSACPGSCKALFAKRSAALDAAGNLYVTGSSSNGVNNDFRTSKYAPDGTLLWSVAYNGPLNGDDEAYAVALDVAGNAYVTGASRAASGFSWGFRTLKYAAADGSLLWSAGFDSASGDDLAYAVAVDGAGDAWVAGASAASGHWGWRTIKYAAADGNELLNKTYAAPLNRDHEAHAIALDGAGNAYVTGYSDGGSGADWRTIKYAPDGNVLWNVAYDGPAHGQDHAHDVAVDAAGNAYVTGYSSTTTGGQGYRTMKYAAANGSVLWSKAWDAPGGNVDLAYAIALDAAGNAYVTGYTWNGSNYDYRTLKYAAADGTELWSVGYAGAGNGQDTAYAIAVGGAGDAYVTGSSWNGADYDYRTLKYAAADGAVLWSRAYDGPGNSHDLAAAVVLDAAGNAYVTGRSASTAGADFRTLEYAASDGTELFSVGSGALVGGDDRVVDVAVDTAGSVYVTGSSAIGSTGRAFRTLKYAADGGVLWNVASSAVPDAYESPVALVLDGAGNVYVTGSTRNGAYRDIRTIKYAASDGHVLWSATYAGPAGFDDYAFDLALDAFGHVYVAGSSWDGAHWDMRTLKYAASDGALVWSSAYDGPAHLDDVPAALALDASGNAVVTGYSYDGTRYGYRTLKLAAADGSLVWSTAYAVAGSGASYATAVALDAAGNALVTGQSPDYRTFKYAAADGGVLWSSADSGGAGIYHGRSIAVDAGGDVYVAGQSAAFTWEYRTLKYAGSDGSLLWHTQYGSPPNSEASALALDGAGSVYVTGRSGATGAYDFRTLKLAAADGAVLWSVGFDGPGDETKPALTADADAAYAAGSSFLASTGYDFLTVKYHTDLQPPVNPTSLASTTHLPATWSNVPAIAMQWSGAHDEAGGSGVAGYSVVFDTAPATLPDTVLDVPHVADPHATSSPALPDGDSHRFHLRTCDVAGNCAAAAHAGPYWIDATLPGAPPTLTSTSHTPGVPSHDPTIDITWAPAVDPPSNGAASGIDGYSFLFDADPALGCDRVKRVEEGTTSATSTPLPNGNWYAHVCARDSAGNWSAVVHAGPYLIGDPSDLGLTLVDDVDPIPVYGQVTYTATYSNAGPFDAPDATLTLTLPPGLAFVSSVPGEPACAGSGDLVKCSLGDLAVASVGTVQVTLTALAGSVGTQTVTAVLAAFASDPNPADNSASQDTRVKFVKGDLQNDLSTDLFLGHVLTGEQRVWLMNGTMRLAELALDPATPVSASWRVVGVDDFDGDDRNDLAWWDSDTGAVEFWRMNGVTRIGAPVPLTGAGPLPLNWRLAATADFDHDGRPDLVWRNTTSQKLVIWTLDGTTKTGVIVPLPDQAVDANWEVVGAVDLNGDGNTDLLWYNVSSGKVVYWWMDAAVQRVSGNFTNPPSASDSNWRVLAVGDYGSGSGGVPDTPDLVWRNATSGRFVVWHMDLAGNRTSGTFTAPDAPADPLAWTLVGPR